MRTLPAPVYFLSNEQIWRLDPDATAPVQVTTEVTPVVDFDVSPTDGALVYLLTSPGGTQNQLIFVDPTGASRTVLVTGPVALPRIQPNGEQIAFHLNEPVDGWQIGRTGSDTGVWVTYRTGGRPSVLQPDDPIPDPENPPDARQFFPIEWSPDGSQLLLGVFYPIGEGGWLAVKRPASGSLVEVRAPCCDASWSNDGRAITIAGGTLLQDAVLGLWQADPSSGAVTTLIEDTPDPSYPLIAAPRRLADGATYLFSQFTEDPPLDGWVALTMQRLDRSGALVPLRTDSYYLHDALWAGDASGVVISAARALEEVSSAGQLLWLSTSSTPAVALPANGAVLRWGPAGAPPIAAICPLEAPLAWQPPGQRSYQPAVQHLQQALLDRGYADVGQADGLFGDRTRAALLRFQQDTGLAATGTADCATWVALVAARAA